ncbi:MAG: glycosyltransferase [Clostridia bacterium]|nr:glycosyltransferase [Clostridia bacterium]
MNNLPLISIVIPVYKTEAYLDRCVQSVLKQTYGNLEIILVNDGSPDNCPQLCDAWAEKDSRIRVVHKENGGLSDARNAGLRNADGALICFIDGDDWIEPLYVQSMYDAIRINDCDAAGCAYRKCADEACGGVPDAYQTRVMDRMSAMSELIDNRAVQQVVWNKLYKRELIEGIWFEKGKYHEDEFWSYQVFARMNRYAAIDYVGYDYFQRADSIMGEGYSLKRLDAVEAKVHRQEYLELSMPELAGKGRVNLLFTCMYHGQMALKHLKASEVKHVFSELERIVRTTAPRSKEISACPIKQQVWMLLAIDKLMLVCRIRNILGIGE